MINTLVALDEFLLGVCTKISHWFQKLTGRTNFFIAKMGLTFASITVGIQIADYFRPFLHLDTSFPTLFTGSAILVIMFMQMMFNDEIEKQSLTSCEKIPEADWQSSLKLRCRLFFLFLSAFLTVIAIYDLSQAQNFAKALTKVGYAYGGTVYAYFSEVTPLPPQRSKIKQWLNTLLNDSRELATVKK